MEGNTIAQIAAEWWSNLLLQETVVNDNGDGYQSIVSSTLANGVPMPSRAAVARFQDELVPAIQAFIAEGEQRLARQLRFRETIDVDYGPCRLLREAGERANCSLERLPIKTKMAFVAEEGVYPVRIEVAIGYGAPFSVLWQKEG